MSNYNLEFGVASATTTKGRFLNKNFRRFFSSFTNTDDQLTLLSYDKWDDKTENEYAYYRDLYIENQRNVSDGHIQTTPMRAPRNYIR